MVRMYLRATENVPESKNHWEQLRSLVVEVSRFEEIDPATVKAFYEEYPSWATGQGAPEGFVNLRIAMLPLGEEVEAKIADALHAKMCEMFQKSIANGQASVSVEVRRMDPATYRSCP